MKNIKHILLTTAMVSFAASSSFADAPTVTAGGKLNFQAGFVSQKDEYKTANTKFDRTQHFVNSARANLNVHSVSDQGMKYGAFIEFGDKSEYGGDATSSTSGKDVELKDTVLYLEADIGRLEMGSMAGASQAMALGAETYSHGNGGIAGDWGDYVKSDFGFIPTSTAGTNISGVWMTTPSLPFDDSAYNARYNKVSFYTPEYNGLQIGISFSVDTGEVGSSNAIQSRFLDVTSTPIPFASRSFKNGFSAGVRYKTQLDKLCVELGATGQYAKAERRATGTATLDQQIHNVKAYTVGTAVSHDNITLAASFGNWGKSMNTKETDAFSKSSTRFYTLGASYTHGSMGMSVSYFESRRMKNKAETISVGTDYALASGMLPYVEATFFKLKPATGVTTTSGGATQSNKNSGSVVFVGTKFNF